MLTRLDVLEHAAPGATVLLNRLCAADVGRSFRSARAGHRRPSPEGHAVDASTWRRRRLVATSNTVLQVCFFA